MKIYNVGIIGTGQIAGSIDDDRKRKSVWSHAGAYKLCTRTKIVAACDIDHERLESFGKSWKVGRLYRDYRDMLKSEEIDIVSICAPTKTHYEILKNVAGCGIKAIFCEKPLAFSYKQCSQAVDICRKNNVLLAVNYFRRWDNLYLKIKEIIDSKQFGTIKTMVSYSNTALYMNASHMIDLMLMLGGRISKVYGKMDSSFVRKVHGLEDPGGIFHFTTESGMEELLYAAGDSQLKHQFEIDLQFTNGRIRSSCYG